ncbi:hypothetical protein EXN66_Car017641 [Channa argus]|uniref:Uncharacterized protein n=1 Tax=Channa argus TaxID=215402 RepID=A0A6G1QI08_CHAAH|nr:hypothetical protein EXN66_Car017641 [Channa argus]
MMGEMCGGRSRLCVCVCVRMGGVVKSSSPHCLRIPHWRRARAQKPKRCRGLRRF